ncbi:hypothetical protein MTR_3g061910 [Medicago truncatula]|uniref:Uncharacterized protein n=1 Tax=Medicago truncatula TaxID=3880 RepID=G7J286_MEDTR|nr:hypothetical protein MTR_3g061910 [Medicago truncatula]
MPLPCHIATNSSFHERAKNIDLNCLLVREKLHQRLFYLLPISTAQQLAYTFTNSILIFNLSTMDFKLYTLDLSLTHMRIIRITSLVSLNTVS